MSTLKPRRARTAKPSLPSVGSAASKSELANNARLPRHALALKAGFGTVVTEVQNMHLAISSVPFNALAHVPVVKVPSQWVRTAHDAITQTAYATVKLGGGAALSAAALAEASSVDADADADANKAPSPIQRKLRSALNGVFGDALAKAGSGLAMRMSLHRHGKELLLTREALAQLKPRWVVFMHGLACDENSWNAQVEDQTSSYASMLERDLPGDLEEGSGVSAICLRYNTGLAVDASAAAFSALMERLVQLAPARLRELTLVGHSMGGLVARSAFAMESEVATSWQRRVASIVCLGTPHQGSDWEKLGHVAAAALSVSKLTQPLARLANARSRGIQDLRRGLTHTRRFDPRGEPKLRLISGSLSTDTSSALGKMASAVLGDGLVAQTSAADNGLSGQVERLHLPGVGHMALLHHPLVYAALLGWLSTEIR